MGGFMFEGKIKKIKLLLVILPMVVTLVAMLFIPDYAPIHYDAHGQVDSWGSKYVLLIFPVSIWVMALLWKIYFYVKKTEREEPIVFFALFGTLNMNCYVALVDTYMVATNGLEYHAINTSMVLTICVILTIIVGVYAYLRDDFGEK